MGRNAEGEVMASAVYLCRLQVGEFAESKKMLFIR
jgi:hypothetical protein